MKKCILLLSVFLLISSCKSASPKPKEALKTEPTPEYTQQIENLDQGIYFRGVGNEPEWSLKISEKTIEFSSLKPGFELVSSNHVEPIRAMDANVKRYSLKTNFGVMTIQLIQQECINTMSGEKKPYIVQVQFTKENQTTSFKGCGNYITPSSLHDIWVLEKLNGDKASLDHFTKELPNLEINSSSNQFMGFAGCNRMNGIMFFEKGSLRFNNVVTTRMACEPNNKENEFLKALQSTTTYKVENMRLILTNQSGVEVVFKKVD